MTHSSAANLTLFESHRALLVAHAYRMLGDLGRAEDIVQESWLRWDGRQVEVDSPRAYLVTLVTRLTPPGHTKRYPQRRRPAGLERPDRRSRAREVR
jgi:RNA polymerase sigma-70 factor (ECF subfamily)